MSGRAMKIVMHADGPTIRGNERQVILLATELARRGHEVLVSCRARGPVRDALEAAGIRTTGIRPRGDADAWNAARFARMLRRERPDAVLLTSWRAGFWGAWAARRAGVRVAVRLGIVRTPKRRAMRLAFRRWVDAMIVNAPEIRDAWTRYAPWFPRDRIHVVLNGIRTDGVDRAAARSRLLAELGVGEDALLVVGAGHVARRKGFDVLLHAFERAEISGAHLVIAGAGEELAELRRRAAEMGIAERVHWLGHRDDVPEVLAGCGIFVLSSRNEGMANVMLEAMAAGTPVIATDISGVRTAIGADEGGAAAGWIVPPDDPAALASTLREVAGLLRDDPAAVHARAAEALRRVEHRFGVERMIDEVEAVLRGAPVPESADARRNSDPPRAGWTERPINAPSSR